VNLNTMRKLSAGLRSTEKAATKEMSLLQQRLLQTQQANSNIQSRMDAELKQAQEAAVKEKTLLLSKISVAQRASEKVSDQLEAEKFSEQLLKANLTHTVQSAELAAAEARKERMGLLVQVSELQEQSSGAQKKAVAAEQAAKAAKEDAKTKINQEVLSAKKQDQTRQHRISALLQETQAAHTNLSKATSAAASARKQLSTLQTTVSKKEEQLRVQLAQSTDLRAARDAASKGEAAFQKMDTTAEASLKQSRQELSSAKRELEQVKSQLAAHVAEAASLTTKSKSLEEQLVTVRKSSAAEEAKDKQQMHETMITAMNKIHDLEDNNENLTTELQGLKGKLGSATAESNSAKDTLMQETNAALRASQTANGLQKSLEQAQKDADSGEKHAAALAKTVSQLQSDRERSRVAFTQRARDEQNWEAKAETLETAAEEHQAEAKKAEAENKQLKSQVHDLTGEEQRADELEEELTNLRQAMTRKNSEEASMAKNLEMLRSLKEHYSTEYEDSKNETDVWHGKVQDLEDSVKTTKQQILAVGRQRDKALERAKEARSQEDEYFEENSRLEQQDEALNAKLAEVGTAANRTQEENKVLDQQVQDLKDEAAREKANSHAAWLQNSDELIQAKEDLKVSMQGNRDLQAQLAQAQAVLSDKERHTLGLPPLKKQATAVKAEAPATPPAAPAATSPQPSAVVQLATPPQPAVVVPLTEKF